ncbi:Caspase 9 [Mactra antiquata]
MNDSHQKTLQHHCVDLVRDLELTADLTAKFIHYGIFNADMIDMIQTVKPRKEQIQKMIFLLLRRGPRAFKMFILSIQETYPWLADSLRETHKTISSKTENEPIPLKERVDIYVHEKFGQSKRLSEEDKKEIRRFLYKQLKNANEDDIHYDPNSRRGSIQSDSSEQCNPTQEESEVNENDKKLLTEVYSILTGQDASESEITVKMITDKAYELNKKVEDLQNEIQNCYSVLGLKDCQYSLHEVLETYKEKNQTQIQELVKYQERLEKLKRQRIKLEEELKNKEKHLQKSINDLANEEHEHEKSKAKIADLKAECARLDGIHHQHLKKDQTLMKLESVVNDLKTIRKDNHELYQSRYGFDEVDGNTLHLPKLSSKPNPTRVSRLSRKSMARDSSQETHYEYPRPKLYGSGSPWKY